MVQEAQTTNFYAASLLLRIKGLLTQGMLNESRITVIHDEGDGLMFCE